MSLISMARLCCNGRTPCRRHRNPREAIDHAAWRSRRSRHDQHIRWDGVSWLITEAPRRQKVRQA